MTSWRTRVDPAYSRRRGVDEVHVAIFEHRDDPGGWGNVVGIQIPETPEPLIGEALRLANARRTRIFVLADTAGQAEAMATRIGLCCAHHRRVPYERAAAGGFGPAM